jgi:anaerobic magnesium-protoporphyrin IX monomethyl ester cyclase
MPARTVVLATPPWSYAGLGNGLRLRVAGLGRDVSGQGWYPSLGLHHLATALEFAGLRVQVVEGYGLDEAGLAAKILGHEPLAVGLTVVTPLWPAARSLAMALMAARPGLRIAVGGPHAQIRGQALLDGAPEVEAVFVGFSEQDFVAWVTGGPGERRLVRSPKHPPERPSGFGRRLASRVPWNALVPNVMFLAELPAAVTFTTWGCPRACASCQLDAFAGPGIPRDTGELCEETSRMAELGVRTLTFTDEVPVFARPSAAGVALVESLTRTRAHMRWGAYLDLWDIEESWFRELFKAGCWRVLLGVESGVSRVRTFAKGREVSDDAVRTMVERARSAGLEVAVRFQIGFPGETVDDARATLRFARSLPVSLASFIRHTGYPGSATARAYAEAGQPEPDLRRWTYYGRPTPPDAMTELEQARLIRDGIVSFYADPRRWKTVVGPRDGSVVQRMTELARRFLVDGPNEGG